MSTDETFSRVTALEIDEEIRKVEARYPAFKVTRKTEDDWSEMPRPAKPGTLHSWMFNARPGSDYSLSLCRYENGEVQIGAKLTSSQESYFWYESFEALPFIRFDRSELKNVLETVVLADTRVVQRRGFLLWTFELQTRQGTEWTRKYSHGAFRFGNFDVPKIPGKEKVYIALNPVLLESIHVFLMSEQVATWVAVKAEFVSENVYRIVDQEYDRTDVIWEFEPGTTVVCEKRTLMEGIKPFECLVAVRPADNPAYRRSPEILETDPGP